ncbi:MAG: hypothetical protein KH195_09365, partial [Clostridiaceae bacterium]|nr:hypothetical protein [Clostridiaceae bacterium]
LYIGLVRERRTGKHGERACERQHQCENLFLMAGLFLIFPLIAPFSAKYLLFCNKSKKTLFRRSPENRKSFFLLLPQFPAAFLQKDSPPAASVSTAERLLYSPFIQSIVSSLANSARVKLPAGCSVPSA